MDHKPSLLGLLLLFAGCTGPTLIEEPNIDSVGSPPSPGQTGDNQEAPSGIGTVEAPDWGVGMWWTFRIGSSYAPAREITTIVVGADDTSYALAAATEATALESIWWHLPPIGSVSRADLAWEAHDAPMSIIQFPLEDGKRWTGGAEGETIDFAARKLPSGAFEVTGLYEGDWLAMRYVYDPAVRQFTNATLNYGSETSSWSTLELIAFGNGWAEGSALPMYDDAFMGGFGNPAESSAAEDFEVPQEVTHVVVGCFAEGVVGDYRVEIVPSQGDSFSCGSTFAGPGEAMQIVYAPGAPGTWRIVPSVVGPGSIFVEAANVWLLSCEPGPAGGLLLKPHGNCHMP